MANKLVFALLCAAVAIAAARELKQTAMSVADLPESLQQLNARLTGTEASLASTSSYGYGGHDLLKKYYSSYEKYYKEHPEEYKPKYEPKYEKEYEPKYEKKEEYKPKYEKKEEYEPKYEKKEEYEPKYEKEYEPKYEDYGYGPNKVVTKVWEKFRSVARPQTTNNSTYMFTSELTCSHPHEYEEAYEGAGYDGIIGLPIAADHTKIVTIGVCEWTVAKVAEQEVNEKATLTGSTQVVCTFNEEAERHCKNGEYLTKGLTLSGQGLAYTFENEKDAEYEVFLSLINSVVNGKHLKLDNGAIQFFLGGKGGEYNKDKTGEMTIVFKH